MRIYCDKGDFDLPPGFKTEFLQNNLFLREDGDRTMPITLPATSHNLQLIEYPYRMDMFYKPINEIEITISHGSIQNRCNMAIHTANEEGISCTIYFDSGSFYSRIGDTMLNALPWEEIRPTGTLVQRRKYLVNLLKNEWMNPDKSENAKFRCGTVLTDTKYTIIVNPNLQGEENIEGLFILNNMDRFNNNFIDISLSQTEFSYLEAEKQRFHVVDKVPILMDIGYGMTPFLKITYILKFIFSQYNFNFNPIDLSYYKNKGDYEDICVLNNVADAIYDGYILFKDLLPEVTIKEFIAEIEKHFGGKFVFNKIKKEVNFIHYISRFFNVVPDLDLTQYISGKIVVGESKFKTINIIEKNEEKNDKNTENIVFDLKKSETVSMEVWAIFTNNIGGDWNTNNVLNFEMINVGNMINKYYKYVINDKDKEEKSNAVKTIMFASFKRKLSSPITYSDDLFQFKSKLSHQTSSEMFGEIGDEYGIGVIAYFYSGYPDFRKHSNITIKVNMKIPKHILETLDITTLKLLKNQPVMIESIKRIFGDDTTQEVTFRTYRPYNDREI